MSGCSGGVDWRAATAPMRRWSRRRFVTRDPRPQGYQERLAAQEQRGQRLQIESLVANFATPLLHLRLLVCAHQLQLRKEERSPDRAGNATWVHVDNVLNSPYSKKHC